MFYIDHAFLLLLLSNSSASRTHTQSDTRMVEKVGARATLLTRKLSVLLLEAVRYACVSKNAEFWSQARMFLTSGYVLIVCILVE